jgi:class 3 adenylate cyclase
MGLTEELEAGVDGILDQTWSIREGSVVPESDDVALAGGGVEIDATILYADLAESTQLVMDFDRRVASKVMKSFLYCASRVIRSKGGEIRSFDGDRVMGIFVGDSKNSAAAEAALKIQYATSRIVRPRAEAKFSSLTTKGFVIRHASGIDTSPTLAVRAGMRGSNDLIWIGRAAAVAAKLSSIRDARHRSFMTADVYRRLNHDAKFGPKGEEMWEVSPTTTYGLTIYRSAWHWRPS